MKENIKKADEELMGTARPPVPIDAYKVLTGYNGIDETLVAYVPTTAWHRTGVYFDGIKYTGPLGQNPMNPLMVEEWFEDFTKIIAERIAYNEKMQA